MRELMLEDKVAMVTGAGAGIGRASAMRFAREGARVACIDISLDTARETVEAIEGDGGSALAVCADVRIPEDVEGAVDAVVKRWHQLNVVFNNAGYSIVQKVEQLSVSEWDEVIDANLRSVFLGVKYAVPHLRKAGGGAVLSTASVAAFRARPQLAAYAAAKAGIVAFTRAAARELASDGIRINCIAPAATNTGHPHYPGKIAATTGVEPGVHERRILESIPLGRRLETQEMAATACFLLSDEASGITGVCLPVDGGYLT